MTTINSWLETNPVIAAVRDVKLIEKAVRSPVKVIFLMTGDIFTINHCVETAQAREKIIFLHVDLIKGIASDKEGVKYLAEKVKPDGIVSTKSHLIQSAKKEGLLAVKHLFLLDSHAFETGIGNVLELNPDAIELMPGLMPRIIRETSKAVACPVIAAGLIKSSKEAQEALNAGAKAVAVGAPELWTLNLTSNKKG
ncbi:glycerol-3-phosphate responsive antiterminator [Paenibacillus solisilvae]|uniref:Glycerol uptake operon antiterminator regulatory protein n=1 Tax=Paenibacillus solisilvae TaxID=2486751 RepID=A0ABW0W4U3_9BACL